MRSDDIKKFVRDHIKIKELPRVEIEVGLNVVQPEDHKIQLVRRLNGDD